MPLDYDELRSLGKSGGSQGAVGKLDCGLEQVAVNMLIVLMAPEACSSGTTGPTKVQLLLLASNFSAIACTWQNQPP